MNNKEFYKKVEKLHEAAEILIEEAQDKEHEARKLKLAAAANREHSRKIALEARKLMADKFKAFLIDPDREFEAIPF